MLTKDDRDLPIEQITKENYLVPANEKGLYHVRIEQKKFDPDTGKRKSIPRIQKFGVKEYATVEPNLLKQGYTLDLLHDPKKWIQEHEAELKAAENERKAAKQAALKEEQEKKAEAEKAARAAEVAAAVKAELEKEREALKAELKAELEKEAAVKETKK